MKSGDKEDKCPQKRTSVPKRGQKTEEKLLEFFYENPTKRHTIRDVAKITKVSKSNVQKYSTILTKQAPAFSGGIFL